MAVARWISKRVLVATGLLALVAGSLALVPTFTTQDVRAKDAATHERHAAAVAALGRIEPVSEIINLGAGISPDRLDSLFVARGDPVKKNDVLGYLGGYAEQAAQRDFFQLQLDEAERRLKTEIDLNQARIESALIHQRQVNEVSPLRIAAQEAAIASLEAKAGNDHDILDSQSQLYSRGVSSRRLQDDQKSIVLQDDANITAAKARLSELTSQFEIDKLDAESQVRLARARLDRLVADVPVESLRRQVALADARTRRLTLLAPIDGRILNIRIKPGEDVSAGTILTMGNTASMRAVAEVYETDISRVRVGQSATISCAALPHPVSGRVARIGNMIFKNDVLNVDPAARADARVVEVWIDLEEPELTKQLTNLTVSVAIDTEATDPSLVRTGQR